MLPPRRRAEMDDPLTEANPTDTTTITALSFPSPRSFVNQGLIIGGGMNVTACPAMGNLGLTSISMPLLKPEHVQTAQLWENPVLPKCRADAFLAQIGDSNPNAEECLAMGPCP